MALRLILILLIVTSLLYSIFNNVYVDTSSSSEYKLNEDDLIIAVLTSGKLLNRLENIENSWKRHFNPENIIFISDDTNKTSDIFQKYLKNPNFYIGVDDNGTSCFSLKQGLTCKDEFLYRLLIQKYPHKKWFLRIIDDTWIQRENLLTFLSKLNPSVPYYIGHTIWYNFDVVPPKYCGDKKPDGVDILNYCDGGTGWIISKPVLEKINLAWPLWRELSAKKIWDDWVFGAFMQALQLPICFSGETIEQFGSFPLWLDNWRDRNYFCQNRHVPVMRHFSDGKMVEADQIFSSFDCTAP
eukprot:TRINITY_DN9588_c0_g1_i1.p1 TRINITY_DN9588_c0_g1~~TRINITY_DN9588_c0_g1_i1.p1  ORF type:complete len:298 (+),score=53.48 TRINITY_DN9588_c0_g1_i1:61-954(+)